KRAHITGNGICVMIVDTASGKVTSAMMAESTGDGILDKVTTNTFQRWRFKPGTVSQVRVPITYDRDHVLFLPNGWNRRSSPVLNIAIPPNNTFENEAFCHTCLLFGRGLGQGKGSADKGNCRSRIR